MKPPFRETLDIRWFFIFTVITAAPPIARDNAPQQIDVPALSVDKVPDIAANPAHLEAVPLERDGKLNKQFKQELLLGKDTNDMVVDGTGRSHKHDDTDGRTIEQQIDDLFFKGDTNHDLMLSEFEIENVVIGNILHHLDESINEAKDVMKVIDQDGDGRVTWEEYHYHFLVDHHIMSPDKAKNHDESEHQDLDSTHIEFIESDRDEFTVADSDGDGVLDELEFLAFRHPEHNFNTLKDMANSIVRSLDIDGDSRLTVDEFAATALMAEGGADTKWLEQEKKYVADRKDEFHKLIDQDHDGFATVQEMLDYINPRNPKHAKVEVRELMDMCDENEDGHLTKDELLSHREYLESTNMLQPERRLHDDL